MKKFLNTLLTLIFLVIACYFAFSQMYVAYKNPHLNSLHVFIKVVTFDLE